MIVVVDYGMGNLGSIVNMLKKAGFKATISSDAKVISQAEKLVLPGVGAFDSGIKNLEESGLLSALNEAVTVKMVPILGICLGMQLMTNSSEEGIRKGLGWIDAETLRFAALPEHADLKIPHMGWNTVQIKKKHFLFQHSENQELRFYFVHTYRVACKNEADVLTTTHYGHDFVSSFQKGNIIGVQFHPEKSHRFGMDLLKNFAAS